MAPNPTEVFLSLIFFASGIFLFPFSILPVPFYATASWGRALFFSGAADSAT
jgi:hypothetical protein